MPWSTWSFSGWTSYRRFEEIRLIQKVHLADWSQRRPSRMCMNPLSWPPARSIPWPLYLIHSKLDFQITYGLPTHCCYVIKARIRSYWGKGCRILRCKDYNAQKPSPHRLNLPRLLPCQLMNASSEATHRSSLSSKLMRFKPSLYVASQQRNVQQLENSVLQRRDCNPSRFDSTHDDWF